MVSGNPPCSTQPRTAGEAGSSPVPEAGSHGDAIPLVSAWFNHGDGIQIWTRMGDYLLGAVGKDFLPAKGDI